MGAYVVEVRGLTKQYGDVVAVNAISFNVRTGVTCGLLGGNGAGKTTTIALLLGLLSPTGGEIRVLGVDMRHDRYAARACARSCLTMRFVWIYFYTPCYSISPI